MLKTALLEEVGAGAGVTCGHVHALSLSVCGDGWLNVCINYSHAPIVCGLTQPQSLISLGPGEAA